MSDKLKQKIAEFVSLAKDCPNNLQERCFAILLEDFLQQHRTKRQSGTVEDEPVPEGTGEEKPLATGKQDEPGKKKARQEDIKEIDLHVKARQFLKKAGLSVDHINQLFYKEEGNFLPLYDDLKTTKGAESQIRIALLHALLDGMHNGNFECNGESVREESQARKCYDAPNFAANFKHRKDMFEGFAKYSKASSVLRLSSAGKTKLVEVIKELQ
jgi:hypothetical protein